MNVRRLELELLSERFAVCRLEADEALPDWAAAGEFSCTTRTRDELSIVCEEAAVPSAVKHEGGWRALKLKGPFAFTETGILASVLAPLAEAKIGIFAVSTFDTDYVLVKGENLGSARDALLGMGHTVR